MSVERALRQQSFRDGARVTLADGVAWSFPPVEAHRRTEPGQPALVWFLGGRSANEFGFCAERLAAAPPGSATDKDKLHLFAMALLHNYMMPYPKAVELVATAVEALEDAVLTPALAAARTPR
jgi:hypothetical protein